jgi:hypothetical protein
MFRNEFVQLDKKREGFARSSRIGSAILELPMVGEASRLMQRQEERRSEQLECKINQIYTEDV